MRGDGTYKHKLTGACNCGEEHSAAFQLPPLRSRAASDAPVRISRTHQKYPAIATHEYRDADGVLRFRVARFWSGKEPPVWLASVPKCMPQRPDGAGDWLDGLDGMGYTGLYRLPELLAAPLQRPVFIVGGEKCADAIAAAGGVATCNAGGEGPGKWHAEYNAPLAGRAAVILADADETGRTHAQAIADSLAGVAASVRLLELEGAHDVADWLAAGHDLTELLEIIACLSPAQNSNPALQDGPIVETLKRENAKLRAQLAIAETSLANLRRQEAMHARIMALPKEQLSPPLKPAAIAVHNVLSQPRARDERGMEQVYRAEIARQCGVSDKTAGAYLRDLASAGVIHREVVKSFDHSEIFISEGPLFETPEEIQTPERANTWGGKRVKRCTSCGSANLEVRVICRDCGEILSRDDVNKEEPEPEAQDAPQDIPPPPEEIILSHLASIVRGDTAPHCPECGSNDVNDYGDGPRCRACDVLAVTP